MAHWLLYPLLTGMVLLSCSGDGGTPDGSIEDGLILVADGPVVQSCNPDDDDCAGSLSCLCCGSPGPRQECLCSKPCTADEDCDDPDQPDCNQPAESEEGVCAPDDFKCCWLCL